MQQHSTLFTPSEAPRLGTLGELDAVAERVDMAAMCQERQRRLLAMALGNTLQAARLRSPSHPNRYVAARKAAECERRAAELIEGAGLLEAQSLACVQGMMGHVDTARLAARIDQFLADQLRTSRDGVSLVAVAS